MTTKPITMTLAALALVGLLGACSSGGDGGDDVASVSPDDDSDEQAQGDEATAEEELVDWVACMRDEGVDIPDPTRDADGDLVISGNGINIGGGDDGDGTVTNDEASGEEPAFTPGDMEAATEVCGAPPALGAGDISEEDRQSQQDAALEFAQCMRDEGIEDFPDPDFSDQGPGGAPQTNDAGPGDAGEGPVIAGPFGVIDMGDPETAAAFEACQDVLGGPAGGPGPDESGEGSDA